MVKTRHSGGLDESNYSAFLSLSPRRTRRHGSYVEEVSKIERFPKKYIIVYGLVFHRSLFKKIVCTHNTYPYKTAKA